MEFLGVFCHYGTICTFDNLTEYRWQNRKWQTLSVNATKLPGTFATEREALGM